MRLHFWRMRSSMHLPDDWYDWYDTCGALMTLFYCDSFRRLFYVGGRQPSWGRTYSEVPGDCQKKTKRLGGGLAGSWQAGKILGWGGLGGPANLLHQFWGWMPVPFFVLVMLLELLAFTGSDRLPSCVNVAGWPLVTWPFHQGCRGSLRLRSNKSLWSTGKSPSDEVGRIQFVGLFPNLSKGWRADV